MIARPWMVAITMTALMVAPSSFAADKIGIFETIYESPVSFSETTKALESALQSSSLLLHGSHDVHLPDEVR